MKNIPTPLPPIHSAPQFPFRKWKINNEGEIGWEATVDDSCIGLSVANQKDAQTLVDLLNQLQSKIIEA